MAMIEYQDINDKRRTFGAAAAPTLKTVDPTQIQPAAQQEAPGFNLPTPPPTGLDNLTKAPAFGGPAFNGPKIGNGVLTEVATGKPPVATNPYSSLWTSAGQDPQRFAQALIQQQGLRGAQTDPTALNAIAKALQAVGVNAQLDTRNDQYHKGLMINGQFVKMLDGSDNWIWEPAGAAGLNTSGYSGQFSDPSTAYLESLLKQQIDQLGQPVVDPARDQFTALINKLITEGQARADKLKGPAYTGAEAEVLRTQALDPIERDRAAARQRALENVGARGMDPSSGIAQALLNSVDQGYDTSRATAQGDIAKRQIEEQRSREQEAMKLLNAITQSQGSVVQMNESARREDDQRKQRLTALASMLYELPTNAAQAGMAAMGQAANPASIFQELMQMNQLTQQNQQQNAAMWAQIGTSLAGLFG